jgi:plasmid stabilization system protein ParE
LREIVWTDEAQRNLRGVRAYIGQFSPLNAQRFAAKLVAAAESLSEYPDRGRPARGGCRELTAIWPYIIRYRVTAEAVVIVRIRHGARKPD